MNRYPIALGLAAIGAALTASPARATDTFAQFAQVIPRARIFTYTNMSLPIVQAQITAAGSSNSVLVSNLGSLVSPSTALVNLNATASALPFMSGGNIEQLFSGSITFTLLAPQMGSGPSVNALTVNFTDAIFETPPGSSAPTLQADSSLGAVITYASDFLDLSGSNNENFALSFSGASSPLNLGPLRLPDFSFSGSGTFAAAVPVPEPASWSMMLAGFGVLGGALRGRRKAVPSLV